MYYVYSIDVYSVLQLLLIVNRKFLQLTIHSEVSIAETQYIRKINIPIKTKSQWMSWSKE